MTNPARNRRLWRTMPTILFLGNAFCSTLTTALVSQQYPDIIYRPGQKRDQLFISATLAKQLMNPLSVNSDNFVVATTAVDSNLVGFAQVRPLNNDDDNNTTSSNDWKLWQEYDPEDLKELPSDWASLPWTKEYREASAQAKAKRERREQIRKDQAFNRIQAWELASVYVEPEFRKQGVGTEVVRLCLQSLAQSGRLGSNNVYLLTLDKQSDWYKNKFAFQQVDDKDVPESMKFEVFAGSILTRFLGERLCCMRSTERTLALIEKGVLTYENA